MILRRIIASLQIVAALVLCSPATLVAQTRKDQDAKPAVTASLVPVGANSDAYWVGDGPGMRAIPRDPGAAPPSTLCVRLRKDFLTIPCTLNRPSIALPVTAGTLRIFANRQAGENGDPPVFGNFKIPTTPGHYNLFLNRAKSEKGWDNPESLVLASSPSAFPSDTFRIINLCAQPIRARIGQSVVDLNPRTVKLVSVPAAFQGKLMPVQAVRAGRDSSAIILRTGIRVSAGQRANLVFFPGRDAKKPCQATWFYQAPPEPAAVTPATSQP